MPQTAAFKGAEVVRSRNPEALKDLDVVIDVGATYEPGVPICSSIHSDGVQRDDRQTRAETIKFGTTHKRLSPLRGI
jgi:uncharacterized UPF0160 family protein